MKKRLVIYISLLVIGLITGIAIVFTLKSANTKVINLPAELQSVQNNSVELLPTFSIAYLRALNYKGSDISIEQTLDDGSNYKRYIASYISDENKIYGLLTVPKLRTP
jgi:hypothetical protein